MKQDDAEQLLAKFLLEKNKILENDERISLNKTAALMILFSLFENNKNAMKMIKELVPLANPTIDVNTFLKESKNDDDNDKLLDLHEYLVAGLNKKFDTAFGKLPNDK